MPQKNFLLLLIFLIFSSYKLAYAAPAKQSDGYYEFEPQKEYYNYEKRKKIIRQQQEVKVHSQYKGDFDDKWYREHNSPLRYYLSFHTGYTFDFNATDAVNSEIIYDDGICLDSGGCTAGSYLYEPGDTILLDSDTLVDINYSGDMSFALKGGFIFRENFRFQTEISLKQLSYSEMTQSDTAETNYNDADSGSYTEPGATFDSDEDDLSLNIVSVMLTVFRDFNKDKMFQPYVGLGLGATNISMSGYEQLYASYQLSLGTSLKFTDNMYLDIGASYFSAGEFDVSATSLTMGNVEYDYTIDNTNSVTSSDETVSYRMKHDFDIFTIGIGYRFLFDAN